MCPTRRGILAMRFAQSEAMKPDCTMAEDVAAQVGISRQRPRNGRRWTCWFGTSLPRRGGTGDLSRNDGFGSGETPGRADARLRLKSLGDKPTRIDEEPTETTRPAPELLRQGTRRERIYLSWWALTSIAPDRSGLRRLRTSK